jgi:hypothetical protein
MAPANGPTTGKYSGRHGECLLCQGEPHPGLGSA